MSWLITSGCARYQRQRYQYITSRKGVGFLFKNIPKNILKMNELFDSCSKHLKRRRLSFTLMWQKSVRRRRPIKPARSKLEHCPTSLHSVCCESTGWRDGKRPRRTQPNSSASPLWSLAGKRWPNSRARLWCRSKTRNSELAPSL